MSGNSTYNPTLINMTFWNDSFVKMYGQEVSDRYQLHYMLCPTNFNLNIKGNRLSSEFDYFKVTIKKWTGFAYWKSEDVIDEALKLYDIILILSDYYFDVEDYENPVKISLQNDYIFSFLPGYTVEK